MRRQVRTLTSAACDDAFPSLVICEACHIVIGTSNLEAKHLLKILALEPDLIPEPGAQIGREYEGGLFEDFIDLGCQDETQIVGCVCFCKIVLC